MIEITKRFMGKVAHSTIVQKMVKLKEIRDLEKVAYDDYAVNHLCKLTAADLSGIFTNPEIEAEWNKNTDLVKSLELPEMMGGVNKGDQRAIFYLLKYFEPNKVLEVGTHIGCSTVHIAIALKNNAASHLTTVDIIDVNDEAHQNWAQHNSRYSPQQLVSIVGSRNIVEFVVDDSTKYLKSCNQKFDFIFLDGSHKASMVFQEIPLAMRLLNQNGIILLHDYFPGNKPIWQNTGTIPGPYLAVKKIVSQESHLSVIPLGELPWRTKSNSNYTSLAVLVRK